MMKMYFPNYVMWFAAVLALGASALAAEDDLSSASTGGGRPTDPLPAPGLWTHLGRTPDRRSLVLDSDPGPSSLADIAWVIEKDALGREMEFIGPGGVVTDHKRVFASALIEGSNYAFGADIVTGEVLWTSMIGVPFPSKSWATPAIDLANGTVMYATRDDNNMAPPGLLVAFDRTDGHLVWSVTFDNELINASPLVTTDLGPTDRAFIVDYGIQFPPGELFCINVDPFDSVVNPYQPGEVVWSVSLGQPTSGNTPAYRNGVVYVSTSGVLQVTPGTVMAFDATSLTPPAPLWTVSAPGPVVQGFFGGVTVSGGFLYAATFNFFGGQLSSCLVKIDAQSGQLLWSAASNRTSSIPIVLGDGRIVLSAGLFPEGGIDFGSRPSVQLFRDHGSFGELLWDSAIDTWIDTNQNGELDTGEYLAIGGWSHHPVLRRAPGSHRLYVGTVAMDIPQSFTLMAYNEMSLIDLNLLPGDPGFVIDSQTGYGSTPAIVGDAMFSIGPTGLTRIGQTGATPPVLFANESPESKLETLRHRYMAGSNRRKGE